MYGHINVIIRAYTRQTFGDDAWRQAAAKADCKTEFEEHSVYDDDETKRLLDAIVEQTGLQRDAFLVTLGEFYLNYVRKIGHDELLRNLGENVLDFVVNLDYIHTYMMSEFPNINMPSFRCDADSSKDKITLHYYSFREGLYPMVIGILQESAKVYHNSELAIELISRTTEKVHSTSEKVDTQNREHVIFSISVSKLPEPVGEGPPVMVAQTRKHAEKQILKEDIDRVVVRLEQIKNQHGEGALPLNKKKAVKTKWRALAKMSVLLGGFVPQIPLTLSVNTRTFCYAFPYHVVLNNDMFVVHSGIKVQQFMPGIRNPTARVDMFFDLLHPHSIDFTFENIKKFINTPFVMKTKTTKMVNTWGKKPMLILRGQMLHMDDRDVLIFLASPFVRCLKDLEQRKMFLADIPMHDVTRDMLWMELMSRYNRAKDQGGSRPMQKDGGKGGQTVVAGGPSVTALVSRDPLAAIDPSMSDDVEGLRRALQNAQAELEEERRKNYWLYNAFLPPTTAEQIMNGKMPESAVMQPVTVLFCDVVAFAQIVTRCNANDVTRLLTMLHSKFDSVCTVHSTFRVEAIGDAYMVVSGLPEPLETHAERIANTALGLQLVAREVPSPYDYGDKSKNVKIRVGIHTGSVVAGVVGKRLPRYVVLGETVNLASRMESHGVPGKIQLSTTTHDHLYQHGFKMDRRAVIDIRGRGKMLTYFLVGTGKASDEQLLGRKPCQNDVTFINDGRVRTPPRTGSGKNRVGPAANALGPGASKVKLMVYKDAPRNPMAETEA